MVPVRGQLVASNLTTVLTVCYYCWRDHAPEPLYNSAARFRKTEYRSHLSHAYVSPPTNHHLVVPTCRERRRDRVHALLARDVDIVRELELDHPAAIGRVLLEVAVRLPW